MAVRDTAGKFIRASEPVKLGRYAIAPMPRPPLRFTPLPLWERREYIRQAELVAIWDEVDYAATENPEGWRTVTA